MITKKNLLNATLALGVISLLSFANNTFSSLNLRVVDYRGYETDQMGNKITNYKPGKEVSFDITEQGTQNWVGVNNVAAIKNKIKAESNLGKYMIEPIKNTDTIKIGTIHSWKKGHKPTIKEVKQGFRNKDKPTDQDISLDLANNATPDNAFVLITE